MLACQLNGNELTTISNHPDGLAWVINNFPHWSYHNLNSAMVELRPSWICENFPESMFDIDPFYTYTHRPFWVLKHRRKYIEHNYPLNINVLDHSLPYERFSLQQAADNPQLVAEYDPTSLFEQARDILTTHRAEWIEKYRPEVLYNNFFDTEVPIEIIQLL